MKKDYSKATQTTITINPKNGDLYCMRTCQTVTHISFDTDYERSVKLLEFTPYGEIRKGALQIIDLPKPKLLKFIFTEDRKDETNEELYWKTNIKKRHSYYVNPKPGFTKRERAFSNCQTDIAGSSSNGSSNTGGNKNEDANEDKDKNKKWNELKAVNTIFTNEMEEMIIGFLKQTVGKLERHMEKILEEYDERVVSTMADVSGDIKKGPPVILCECNCGRGSGAAIPMIQDLSLSFNPEINKEILKPKKLISNKRISKPFLKKSPSLSEQIIRLPMIRWNSKCHCAKSKIFYKSGMMAERVVIEGRSERNLVAKRILQTRRSELCDLSEICAEKCFQQFMNDNVNLEKVPTGKSDTSSNFEMPWDLLAYASKTEMKKEASKEKTSKVETKSPSKLIPVFKQKLKEKTIAEEVEAEKENDQATKESEQSISVNVSTSNKNFPSTLSSEKEEICKESNINLEKNKEEEEEEGQVVEIYNNFKDSETKCVSSTEMAWDDVVHPENSTAKKLKEGEETNSPCEKSSESTSGSKSKKRTIKGGTIKCGTHKIDIKISFVELNKKLYKKRSNHREMKIKVSDPSASNLKKTFIVQGSFSQPLMLKPVVSNKKIKDLNLITINNLKKERSGEGVRNFKTLEHKDDRVAKLLESCKKEMEPIKEGINKLRERIRELNLPDISSFQENPTKVYLPENMCSSSSFGVDSVLGGSENQNCLPPMYLYPSFWPYYFPPLHYPTTIPTPSRTCGFISSSSSTEPVIDLDEATFTQIKSEVAKDLSKTKVCIPIYEECKENPDVFIEEDFLKESTNENCKEIDSSHSPKISSSHLESPIPPAQFPQQKKCCQQYELIKRSSKIPVRCMVLQIPTNICKPKVCNSSCGSEKIDLNDENKNGNKINFEVMNELITYEEEVCNSSKVLGDK